MPAARFLSKGTGQICLSAAWISLQDNALVVFDKAAGSKFIDYISVHRPLFVIEDIMDICLWQSELCTLDKLPDLCIILLLIHGVCELLESLFKRKRYGLRILLLQFYGINEFSDIHLTELAPGFIIQHRHGLPSRNNHCREGILLRHFERQSFAYVRGMPDLDWQIGWH